MLATLFAVGAAILTFWAQMSFYAADDGVPESVTIDGIEYNIRGTAVSLSGTPVSFLDRLQALRFAHMLRALERTSSFSLSGTDVELLSGAIHSLEATRDELAAAQTSEDARRRVSEQLFPMRFLRSLVELEENRRTSISTRSDEAYAKYRSSLDRTLAIARVDIAAFRQGYAIAVRPEHQRTATGQGLVTSESTMTSLDRIEAGFERIERIERLRSLCAKGLVFVCERDIEVEAPAQVATSTDAESRMHDILSIFDEARVVDLPDRIIVGLTDSECLKHIPGPDYVEVWQTDDGPYRAYAYVGDILLRTFDEMDTGPTLSWFAEQQLTYLSYNPLIFYTCPQSSIDIARARALAMIAETLYRRPPRPVYEDRLLNELKSAIERDDPRRREFEALLMMYRDRSAGLEDAVYDVVHGLKSSLAMHAKGVPTDLSESVLFATHSGYYTLFLAHNATAGAQNPVPYSIDSEDLFGKVFFRYSTTLPRANRAQVVHDLRFFFSAHNR